MGGDPGAGRRRDCHFHLLVPATPAAQLDPGVTAEVAEGGGSGEAGGRGPDRKAARPLEDELDDAEDRERGEDLGRRLARQLAAGPDAGAGGQRQRRDRGGRPVDAVRVVLHRWEFDEVILSTLPGRRSRWLAADLPTKIRAVQAAGDPDHRGDHGQP